MTIDRIASATMTRKRSDHVRLLNRVAIAPHSFRIKIGLIMSDIESKIHVSKLIAFGSSIHVFAHIKQNWKLTLGGRLCCPEYRNLPHLRSLQKFKRRTIGVQHSPCTAAQRAPSLTSATAQRAQGR